MFTNAPTFYKKYDDRYVSSIYFDDLAYSSYHENIDGDINKEKNRIRFYNDDLTKIFFEIKRKNGTLCQKDVFELSKQNINFSDLINKKFIDEILLDKAIKKYNCFSLTNFLYKFPILNVTYNREYYQCSDTGLRVTIDKNIQYKDLSGKIIIDDDSYIIEIKTDYHNIDEIDNRNYFIKKNLLLSNLKKVSAVLFRNHFDPAEFSYGPITQVRSSKYSYGLSQIFSITGCDSLLSEEYIRAFD